MRLENFEGFLGKHRAPLRPLTLIVGPNSSGKSALVHALALLRQSVALSPLETSGPLLFKGHLVDLGDFRNVVHGHDTRLAVGIGLTSLAPASHGRDAPDIEESFDLALRWSAANQHAVLDSVLYSLPEKRNHDVTFRRVAADQENLEAFIRVMSTAALRRVTDEICDSIEDRFNRRGIRRAGTSREAHGPGEGPSTPMKQRVNRAIRDAKMTRVGFLPYLERPKPPEGSERPDIQQYEGLLQWGRMLSNRLHSTIEALKAIAYLGPLRTSPRRFEPGGDFQHGYVGPGGEGTAQLLNVNPDLLVSVNTWLERLEIPYTLDVRRVSNRSYASLGELLALELTDIRTQTKVSPADVGFGISQVLPVVTQSLLARNKTILIEQPEIHLHPRLQARLGSLFAEVIASGSGAQIIAETHSEMLILRIQRLIAEGELNSKDVQVLYVGAGSEGSWINELPLSDTGRFEEEWPGGFFEERYDEWIN